MTFSVIFPYRVTVMAQQSDGLPHRIFLVELDCKSTLLIQTVVDDGDILDGDRVYRQNRRDHGDGTAFIDDVAVDPVGPLDRSRRGKGKGIPLVTALLKHMMDIASVPAAHMIPGLDHAVQERVHHLRDIIAVFHAD